MKYVFFGTPEFAAIILEKLITAGFIPAAVVCNPDRPVGRKKIVTAPPAKTRIMNYESRIKEKITILQPEKLSIIHNSLFSLHPDFAIVASYAKIIPKEILEIPRLGTIGVHPSLLPKFRGASPIQSTILAGEAETGVTLYLLDEKVDHGSILANFQFPISNFQTYKELGLKLAEVAGDLLIETLPKFVAGEITPIPQDESKATYTKKFVTEDGYVEPADLARAQKEGGDIAVQIDRKIRALNPEPGIYTVIDDKRTKLLEANVEGGMLRVTKIQREGGKPINLVS